ncbi:MAG: single-stranded DNA-binding protein [Victivallales bacterium]|nr:single-stranded DNA-binding protein [Victivallales bacterium]
MCASFNKVLLMGNLTRDPEARSTSGGQAVVTFGLAVNRTISTARGEQREEVTFVDVEAWGRQGEVVQQYCRKGSPLFVEGRLRFDQWQDRETGQKRNRLTVTAETIQLLGSPARGVGYGEDGQMGVPMQGYQPQQGYGMPPVQGDGRVPPRGGMNVGPMPEFQPISDDTPNNPF